MEKSFWPMEKIGPIMWSFFVEKHSKEQFSLYFKTENTMLP